MSIRPFRDIKRNKTKVINVGPVKVGGNNPISVQSMTNTLITDINKTIKQIHQISEAGADIVRVSCPDEGSTNAIKEIVKHIDIPLVADIHFHYKRAIEAAESGASCLRINPGNIGDKKKIKFQNILIKRNVSKISIIGVGMITTPGVTYRMFKALSKQKINIQVISTSEIKISVLIDKRYIKKAVKALHKEFELQR